ncbi:MAG: D-2-hydroxyacid dehydrogenase [Cyanobacteriota bacterium]|nr:D-2-hydroxyacid dehydrogenase [Cyanobacteriota bacterium]
MKFILPAQVAAQIQPHLPGEAQVVLATHQGELNGDAHDAEVCLYWFWQPTPVLNRMLQSAPAIRWLHTPTVGVNHLLTPALLALNPILTNGAGANAIPIAEYVLTMMLSHTKQLTKLQALHQDHHWLRGLELEELKDQTLLVLGAGNIGREIAKRADAFGVKVWGSRRHPEPMPYFERVVGSQQWQALVPEVDFLIIATPLTPETTGMVNAAVLQAMRPTAYLINIARGGIVDQTDLVTALQSGWIAGATLDALWTEPLPAESPLWTLPNLFITPHCSGFSPAVARRSLDLFLDNLNRYLSGIHLRNQVDIQAGY